VESHLGEILICVTQRKAEKREREREREREGGKSDEGSVGCLLKDFFRVIEIWGIYFSHGREISRFRAAPFREYTHVVGVFST